MAAPEHDSALGATSRVRIWYGLIIAVIAIFGLRLFYVQIIRYDHYKKAALSDQLKQYEIPATRGIIEAHDGTNIVPIVLNQKLYTIYADPTYVKDIDKASALIAATIGGNASTYADEMHTKNTRYVVLAKKVTEAQKNAILQPHYPGIGAQEQDYRTYPQGNMAAQLLGFVNNEGVGTYGIEQALNKQLEGTPGQLKAITDANGVPLAASKDNIMTQPTAGDNVVLTVDIAMQQQLEDILKKGVEHAKGQWGSAVIMDPNTGAVKAMANYPTYDPSNYQDVTDPSVFNNAAVSHPIEVGSTMKTLTTAAALDQGVIQPDTTYYDPAHWLVDGFNITNIEEDGGPGERSIEDILNLSLNTGATWELMQMGGGKLDAKGRNAWYNYMSNHYRFGKETGIEQGYESPGYVPLPANNGAGIDLTYANTAFGQAMTATPIQMAAALSSVLNGGTYYQPRLVDAVIAPDGTTTKKSPKVVERNVVAPKVGQELVPLMQQVVQHHYILPPFNQDKYIVGGKTGTAQVAKPSGGYYDNVFNGTYVGFVGGDKVQYVIVVFVYKPTIAGYAGTAAAQPIFASLAHMLINNSFVMPKSH